MAGELTGFEKEFLDRRIEFLLDRAAVHEKSEDVRSQACAGTLLRDAAAIAFMRNDPELGKEQLERAGEHFVGLGLPHGVLLMMLASKGEHGHEALVGMMAAATDDGGLAANRREMGPLFASALRQPEQLLALETSAAMANVIGKRVFWEEGALRERIHPYRSHPTGMSGVSLAAFIRLMDFGRGAEFPDIEAFGNPRLDMMSLMTRRGRQLASAYEDHHHWRLLLSPAALLDFDLVALFVIWFAHGRPVDEMIPPMGPRLPPMTMLPMKVAQTLGPRRQGLRGD